MKYILVFIGLFLFFPFASAQEQAQENTTIDNPNNQTVLDNESSEKSEGEGNDKKATVEQEVPSVETSLPAESDFDVFRPSEDISEDLAVPFPVDI